MSAPLARADALRAEATRLLDDTGLLARLGRHGEITLTGSFAYDLMTRRDIDVCVALDRVDLDVAFEIGREMAALPGTGAMLFRNEFALRTPGNPLAVFWRADVKDRDGAVWTVEVLIAERHEVARVLAPGERLMAELTPETRGAILEIKAAVTRDPAHPRDITSTDIHDAVLRHGVMSFEEWALWREARK